MPRTLLRDSRVSGTEQSGPNGGTTGNIGGVQLDTTTGDTTSLKLQYGQYGDQPQLNYFQVKGRDIGSLPPDAIILYIVPPAGP